MLAIGIGFMIFLFLVIIWDDLSWKRERTARKNWRNHEFKNGRRI